MESKKSFFIVLPKSRDILFTSWKIDITELGTNQQKSFPGLKNNVDLFIDVYSINNGERIKIDSIPVHGLENKWHIFTNNDYYGKRIVLSLCYSDIHDQKVDILTSKEIDISFLDPETISKKIAGENSLYRLSEIDLEGFSGSGNNCSW